MSTYIAKTLFGLEDVLEKELLTIGAYNLVPGKRAVSFEGDTELLYKANYTLRTALSILMPVLTFSIKSAKDLYNTALKFAWENIFDLNQTFSVIPVVYSDLYNHTGYPGLLLKDAIVDRFRNKYRQRPSVDTQNPDITFNCHISDRKVTISLDSSQIPLFKRAYRSLTGIAPINEVLAAAIIMKSGWDGKTKFMDPMCGSGTIPIEAAMIASNIPPGKFRNEYGFMKWKDFNRDLYDSVRNKADKLIIATSGSIYGMDISERSIIIARDNIKRAGLSDTIRTRVSDFLTSDSGEEEYFIIMNPPYGERLENKDLLALYSGIGERLKHGFAGSSAWIISSDTEAMKSIGLKPSKKFTLYNGKLQTILAGFELYKGSKKKV